MTSRATTITECDSCHKTTEAPDGRWRHVHLVISRVDLDGVGLTLDFDACSPGCGATVMKNEIDRQYDAGTREG